VLQLQRLTSHRVGTFDAIFNTQPEIRANERQVNAMLVLIAVPVAVAVTRLGLVVRHV
jgi:hypothetical protein